MTKSCSSLCKS